MARALAGVVLASLVAACAAGPQPVPVHDRADLETQAVSSLESEYALLIDPSRAPSGELVADLGPDCQPRSPAARRAGVEARRLGNLGYAVRFVDADVEITSAKVRADGERIVLRAQVFTSLYFLGPSSGTTPHVTKSGVSHDFFFENADGRWVLVLDHAQRDGGQCRLPAVR